MSHVTIDSFVRRLRSMVADIEAGQLSDTELLQRFVERNDEAAFAVLIHRHGAMVLHVCRRQLRHIQDAEDAFQATFLVLATKAHNIRRPASLACWLHGVALRISTLARCRSERKRISLSEEIDVSDNDHPNENCNSETFTILDEELRQLTEKHRAPLVLCYLEERTQEQAARELGLSKSTLRRRLTRGLDLLRQRMDRRGTALSTASALSIVPNELVDCTLTASILVALGNTTNVSSNVAALVQEGVRFLTGTRIKIAVSALLLMTLIAIGAVSLAMSGQQSEKAKYVPQVVPVAGQPKKLPRGMLAQFGSAHLRHGRPVTGVQFRKDGKLVYSASEDFTVRSWDVATGEERDVFVTGISQVIDFALIADGKKVAAVTHDRGVFVFDGESHKKLMQFGDRRIRNVVAVPDGKTLITGGEHGVHVWPLADPENGHKLKSVQPVATSVVSLSPDGKLLATFNNGTLLLQVVDWRNDKTVWSGKMSGPVTAMAFNKNGKLYASAQVNGASELWRIHLNGTKPTPEEPEILRPKALIPTMRDQNLVIRKLAISPDRITLYAVIGSRELWAIDLETGTLKFAVSARPGQSGILHLAVSPDGKTIATGAGGREHAVRLWDAKTGKEKTLGIDPNRSNLFGLGLSRDGKIVAAANSTGRLTIWESATGKILQKIDCPNNVEIMRVALSSDGKIVACGCGNEVLLWDVGTGTSIAKLQANEQIHTVEITPDRMHLIAGSGTGNVYIWNVKSKQLVRTIQAHKGDIWDMDISPDGTMIATASFDRSVAVFRVDTGREVARRTDHKWFVRTVAFSPDGLRVATSGQGTNGIFVWEVATGELIQTFHPEWTVTSVDWCAGGRVLATSHFYDRMHFFDVATGKWLAMSRDRPGPFHWRLLSSPDGRKIYTAGSDSAVRVWNVKKLVGELPPIGWENITQESLESAWDVLAKRDPVKAHEAIWQLAAGGDRTVELLAKKLKPAKRVKIDEANVRKLIRELGDKRFVIREAATAKLKKSDPAILPILKAERKKTKSVEIRQRLALILLELKPSETATTLNLQEMQQARVLQVLFYLNNPESRKLLATLAGGNPDHFLTRQAKLLLKRMPYP